MFAIYEKEVQTQHVAELVDDKTVRERTMFGSFVFTPDPAKGLKPAMTPCPRGPFSWVNGSAGFCPACMVGS